MTRPLLALLLLIALGACAKKDESAGSAPMPPGKAVNSPATRLLAYEHALSLEAEEQKVAVAFEAAQAACREAAAEACVVLQSHIRSGRQASASLTFRAAPSGIRKLVAALGRQGEITSQSTKAEDLASPIEDAEKKLQMLSDYRAKLQGLLGRAGTEVDALIKLNRELAQVQSEIEALSGTHAHLMQRVQTEILRVSIGAVRQQSFWRPIAEALAEFGSNLSHGISGAITGLAYLLPWAFALLCFTWAGRKLWRRRKLR